MIEEAREAPGGGPVEEVRGELRLAYRYSYGSQYDRFYREMRDNRLIMGVKCSRCGAVLLPPRPYCGFCFVPPEGWSSVADTGTVLTYTVIHMEFDGQVTKPPYIYALIMLDGADVHLPHLIGEVEPEEVRTGMRVRAVWSEDRKGTLHDIKYFRPV